MRKWPFQIAPDRNLIGKIQQEEARDALNNVETLVILRTDQLRYFRGENEFYDIQDMVVVNSDAIEKLYQRVGQLATETIDEQRKHRIQVIHLARMKSDCKFMNQQINHLKERIRTDMIQKFGAVVDLDEMEEAILKKFLYKMQSNGETICTEYERKIGCLKVSGDPSA